MTGRSFALIVAWGVVGCLLILADAPAALRLPIGGSFLILGVGVTLAAALPTVTGLGRYALIVMAGASESGPVGVPPTCTRAGGRPA